MLLHKRRRSGSYAEAWEVVLSGKLASENACYLINDVLLPVYADIAAYRSNPQEVFSMYSEALRIMDQNSMQLMVDEMSQQIKELEEKNKENEKNIREKDKALFEKDNEISEKDKALFEKDKVIIALQKELKGLKHNK